METTSYRFYTQNHGHPIDFRLVDRGITRESSRVLQVTTADLAASFTNAMSAVVGRNHHQPGEMVEALGHVRFSPLLDPLLKNKLDLQDCPEIWEMGTGFMDPETFRGKGLYGPLRNELLKIYIDKIRGGEVMIMGTTKTKAVLRVLKDAMAMDIGAFYTNPLSLPFISAFTCVYHGSFGQGFQNGTDACPKRVNQTSAPIKTFFNAQDQQPIDRIIPNERRLIPCYFYAYGNPETAQKIDGILKGQFGTPDNLVTQLRQPDINYYQEPIK
ncbi:hypothetical protein COS12_01995 [Candidatus Roizmanbacteria bacterium CG01_land_8_20_14_3_00_33_9]|uniref:Uncharacterized protein n=1 Tax=Candidatus Roizmanbacteria bacterium CG01_land_8_20_14_3_00_33_9 TaxID=1974843 RepID=A0A2M7E495_9BACT|nr:MAG: hypothetical protein COS12_01995 [Candidatus Roizmanbacteria bacterium CG01_land_8_20_14_3_00_33_9]